MTGVQDTLKQFNNTVPIALDLTFGKDSKIGSKLIENFNIQSATRMTEYENLKNQLTEMLQDMIEEGASAIEINEAAQEIIGKMRDLYKQVEDFNRQFGETKFKLKYGSVDFGKEGLMGQPDIESYKEVLKNYAH